MNFLNGLAIPAAVSSAGKLTRFSPALVLVVVLAAGTSSAQAGAEGVVYTADEYGNSISAVDLKTGAVIRTALPIAPHNVQITADGSSLLAVGEAAESGHGHAGEDADHAESDGGDGTGLLLILDPDQLDSGPAASIPVGAHPAHVVVDAAARRAFVTAAGENAVTVVDLAKASAVRKIEIGRYPHGLRLSPDGAEAYVAAVEEGAVSVIDTSDLAEVARIPVGAAPVQVGFTPDGSRVYVSLRDENSVAVIDTASREVIGKIPVGRNPIQVHATPDGARVYVANQGTEADPDDSVLVIDVASNEVIDTVRTGAGAHGVSVSADGSQVFVTNIAADSLSVIEEASRRVVRTYEVGDGPNGVTFRPAGGAQGTSAGHTAHHQGAANAAPAPGDMKDAQGSGEATGGSDSKPVQSATPMMQDMMSDRSGGLGMMSHGMARMMAAMMDADGDAAVSLEEFQAAHARMFRAMDADSDGRLTPEEVHGFTNMPAGTGQP
jgi:YVTN family beta-propeller protein